MCVYMYIHIYMYIFLKLCIYMHISILLKFILHALAHACVQELQEQIKQEEALLHASQKRGSVGTPAHNAEPSPIIQQDVKKTRLESPIPASQPRTSMGDEADLAPQDLMTKLQKMVLTPTPNKSASSDPYVDLVSPEQEDPDYL